MRRRIRLIKDTEKGIAGKEYEASEKSAESYVSNGYAVYVNEPDVKKDALIKSHDSQINKISISSVYKDLEPVFKKYIDTSDSNLCLLRTWVIGTYFHPQFETFPLLYLNAQKRSGKTRTLKLCSSLSAGSDGSVMTNPSETFLFRHKLGAVFFDEMENLNSKELIAFRQTLNAVYKRGNRIVKYREKMVKGEGRQFVEEVFTPYYPLAIANIQGSNDVLGDRSIQIILQRSSRPQTQLIEDFQTNQEILSLRDNLSRLKSKIPEKLFEQWNSFIQGKPMSDNTLLPFFNLIKKSKIHGRALELFFPFFVIADLGGYISEMLSVAKEYVKLQEEEESVSDYDELLKKVVENVEFVEFIGLGEVLNIFRNCLDQPEGWINSKWLGRALKRLGLISRKRLINGKTEVLLKKKKKRKIKNNSTNSTNTTNTTNSTNSTKDSNMGGHETKVPVCVLDSCSFCGSPNTHTYSDAVQCFDCKRRKHLGVKT